MSIAVFSLRGMLLAQFLIRVSPRHPRESAIQTKRTQNPQLFIRVLPRSPRQSAIQTIHASYVPQSSRLCHKLQHKLKGYATKEKHKLKITTKRHNLEDCATKEKHKLKGYATD